MRYSNFVLLIAASASLAGCGSQAYPEPDPELVAALRAGGGEAASPATGGQDAGEGWGGMTGRFLFAGNPPQRRFLDTGGKDPQACSKPGVRIPDESLVVDPQTKALQNVVVFLRQAPRVIDQAELGEIGPQVFDQQNCIFLTHVFACRAGHPVTIKNSDPVGHNTNCRPTRNSGFNDLLAPGGELNVTFARAETSPANVSCNVHNWMKAYIFPREDPYVAVSAEDGAIEIQGLPAGVELEFQVWHESAAGAGGGLAAKSDWGRGRFTATIPQDGVLELGDIAVPPAAFRESAL